MEYSFQTLEFANQRKLLRIRFLEPEYEGLERFFNDDASLLLEELADLSQISYVSQPLSLAGNRCEITFFKDAVWVEDQWDEDHFPPVRLDKKEFDSIFSEWEQKSNLT